MKDFWLPLIASAHGKEIDNMLFLVHWLMLVLFVGWGSFFLLTLFKFRASKNPKANYQGVKSHFSTWAEIAVAFSEVVLIVGFALPLWAERVKEFPSESEATVVKVVAQQFAWNVHYPGKDGVFGKSDPSLVDEENNPLGLDSSDPNALDDITTINNLYLPVNKPAVVHLSSKDVIHSFGIPEMRVKQDAIPGMSIPLWFEPTMTTAEFRKLRGKEGDQNFTFEIACAQLCGLGHYKMRGYTHVLPENEFQKWLDSETPLLAGSDGEGDDFW